MNFTYKLNGEGKVISEKSANVSVIDKDVVSDEQGLCLMATSEGRKKGRPTRVTRRSKTDPTKREVTFLCPEGVFKDGICNKEGLFRGRPCVFSEVSG